jgi:Uma2 family endonuclease
MLGIAFDSSTGFKLPNGAIRSPDAAWVKKDRLDAINSDPSDSLRDGKAERLKPLQAKMQKYIKNGVRLGWLLNPQDQTVEIYRLNETVEVLQSPARLSGEEVLVGFELDLKGIFN